MTIMEIEISEELGAFVRQQVASGAYASVGEVVADAIRRLALDAELTEQERISLLRKALQPGLDDIQAGRLSDRSVSDFMQDAKTPRR